MLLLHEQFSMKISQLLSRIIFNNNKNSIYPSIYWAVDYKENTDHTLGEQGLGLSC